MVVLPTDASPNLNGGASIPTPLSEPKARIRHLKWALGRKIEPASPKPARDSHDPIYRPAIRPSYNVLTSATVDGPGLVARELAEVSNILRGQRGDWSSSPGSSSGSPKRNEILEHDGDDGNCKEGYDVCSSSPVAASSHCHTPSTNAPASSTGRWQQHPRPPPALDFAFIEDTPAAGHEGSIGDVSAPSGSDLRYCSSQSPSVPQDDGHFLHGTAQLGGGHVLHASVFVPFRASHVKDLHNSAVDEGLESCSSINPTGVQFPFADSVQSEPALPVHRLNDFGEAAVGAQQVNSLPCINLTQKSLDAGSVESPKYPDAMKTQLYPRGFDMTTPARLDANWESSDSSNPGHRQKTLSPVGYQNSSGSDSGEAEGYNDDTWERLVSISNHREALRDQSLKIAAAQERLHREAQALQSQMQSVDMKHERLKEACDEAQRDLCNKRQMLNEAFEAKHEDLQGIRESLDMEIRARTNTWLEQDRLRQPMGLRSSP